MRTLGIAGVLTTWAAFFVCPVSMTLPLGAMMVASVFAAVSGEK